MNRIRKNLKQSLNHLKNLLRVAPKKILNKIRVYGHMIGHNLEQKCKKTSQKSTFYYKTLIKSYTTER
jgi:hypothetical protein